MGNIWEDVYSKEGEGRENFRKNLTNINDSRIWILDKLEEYSKKKGRYKVKNVLEIGCGLGIDLEEIKKQKCEFIYTGCDSTKEFIDDLNEKYEEDFYVEDIHDISFNDKSFDCVYCRHVLEHIKDPFKAIDEMFRVAKKFVIIGFFRINDKPSEIGVEIKNKYGTFIQNSLNKEEFKEYIEKYGKILEVETFEHNENWFIRKK